MEQHPIQNDARRRRRQQQLGPDAVCVLCGEAQWETLIPVRRSLLEAHHVAGLANDATVTVAFCRNCHAKLTEQLRQCGASMEPPETILDKVVAMVRAVGALLVTLGNTLVELADKVAKCLLGLDRTCPTWRTCPEAAA